MLTVSASPSFLAKALTGRLRLAGLFVGLPEGSHLQPSWATSSEAHGGSAPRRVQVTTEA